MTDLFPALRRYAGHRTREVRGEPERCDLCSEPIAAEHRHVLELESRTVHCACPACAVLFAAPGAGAAAYRLIPERRLCLDDWQLSDEEWERLCIPVGLACLMVRTETRNPAAFYPSPVGAVEAPVDASLWREWQHSHQVLAGLVPDVEVLLVNRVRAPRGAFLVPIDDAFRLVALVRRHWKGMSGGPELWEEIDRYLARVADRAVAMTRT